MIEDLRELREKENMSYEMIAELSGIPLEIVTRIFTGEIKEPQYMSLLAMEQVIVRKKKIPFYYDKEQVTFSFLYMTGEKKRHACIFWMGRGRF